MEEHNAKRPQIVRHTCLVRAERACVNLSGIVPRGEELNGHLRRAVSRGGHLAAKRRIEHARNVEVDELPLAGDSHDVQRFQIGMDALVLMQVIESKHDVVGNIADGEKVVRGDAIVGESCAQTAIAELQDEQKAVAFAGGSRSQPLPRPCSCSSAAAPLRQLPL